MKKFPTPAAIVTALMTTLCSLALPGQVRWLEASHDFGAFKEDDGKVTCHFRFVNTGKDAVSVRAARASCGCTAPSFTKTPVEPGDTGTITVRFNPTGRPGRFSKSVAIDLAGETDLPRQNLVIKGVVIGSSNTLRSRYPIEAGALKFRTTQIPFGSVTKGKAKSAFLEVYNSSEDSVSPQWERVPQCIRVASSDKGAIPPGEQAVYSMVLTPDATSLYGIFTDSLLLGLPGEVTVKIDVTAILEEDFSRLTPGQRQKAPVIDIEGDRVDFGVIDTGTEETSRNFTITNRGQSDLMLRRVYTIDPGVTVRVSTDKVKKGKTAIVTVTVKPGELPADILNARIQVIANDPDNPITIVRAVGEVRQ